MFILKNYQEIILHQQ